jgi:hypothetical protein
MTNNDDGSIIINFKDCFNEVLIILLVIGFIILTAMIISKATYEPVPVLSYQAEFYDCVETCYQNSFNNTWREGI